MNKWFIRWQRLRQHPVARVVILVAITLLLIGTVVQSIKAGQVAVKNETIYKVTLDKLSDQLPFSYESDLDYNNRFVARDAGLILNIRWPRVVMAGLVGAGLAIAGAALQGVFRSPLVEPGLIGVSSGAAIGAVTALGNGWNIANQGAEWTQIAMALLGGALMTALVYRLSYTRRRTDATTMLLIGVAVNAIGASYVGLMTFRAGQETVGDIVFWTLGSLGSILWEDVEITWPVIAIGSVALLMTTRSLNVMALGEAEAHYLGIHVERLRGIVIFFSALMVGVGVSFVGIVAFVGLVVPHFIRMLFGPDHRLLLPASFLGGAIFLIAADVWARTITVSEVPLGVITTLIGGPFFLLLLLVYHRQGVRI
jgi:iron complex transport system permease protein